ncbi:MAG: helix-turn-helix domain-containing protein [Oscillospiraceae bacterium]|nr:helix-turn-helix domain-containing protein [Oscillospiraceae bacterium]
MDDLKDIVSRNIIYLRTNNKMTQLELGEALNYSDKAVSKWERAEAIPDAYVLKKLSILFGVSVDYLLTKHDEDELKAAKTGSPQRFDRRIISLISFLGTWTLAVVIFTIIWFFGSVQWLVFVYALPISLILMIVFTAIWSKRKTNIFFISLLVWSVLAAIYLTFIDRNWWLLFTIGIPAQIIILLSFKVKIMPKK